MFFVSKMVSFFGYSAKNQNNFFWVVDYYLIISITLCIYFVCSSAKYK